MGNLIVQKVSADVHQMILERLNNALMFDPK